MKKILSVIGIGAALFFAPACSKSDVKPNESANVNSVPQDDGNMASLYVVLASEPCGKQQNEITSAYLDIRGIKVFNSVHGWEELAIAPESWDLIAIQAASDPVAVLTQKSKLHAGTITKIAFEFGPENKLTINNRPFPCFKVTTKEVVVDLKQEIRAGTLGQLAIKINTCGNIRLINPSDDGSCFVLEPVMSLYSYRELPPNL